MPKIAANLTMLFNEYAFLDRFEHAANAGFVGVEYLFPYAYDVNDLKQRLDDHQLTQVLFNFPAGDWDAGDRGLGCLAHRRDEFRIGVDTAIEYAQTLGNSYINCLAGIKPQDVSKEQALSTYVEHLHYAAERAEEVGLTVLVEPINAKDMPDYLINTLAQGIEVLDLVDHAHVGLQADIYHMQRMEGDLLHSLSRHQARIRHIQFADNPGRHEPGSGEINFHRVFDALDDMGYEGWVSAEYVPEHHTGEGLRWLHDYPQAVFS